VPVEAADWTTHPNNLMQQEHLDSAGSLGLTNIRVGNTM
jgi:hypothetical protein